MADPELRKRIRTIFNNVETLLYEQADRPWLSEHIQLEDLWVFDRHPDCQKRIIEVIKFIEDAVHDAVSYQTALAHEQIEAQMERDKIEQNAEDDRLSSADSASEFTL